MEMDRREVGKEGAMFGSFSQKEVLMLSYGDWSHLYMKRA